MKKTVMFLGVIALVLVMATPSFSAQTNYDIGKVGGSELKIGLGPRPVGMGEAFVGLADDVNCTAWNPAGLAQISGYQASFMHNIYLEQTSLEYLAYAQNLMPGAGIGANLMFLNFGKLDKVTVDNSGLPEVVGDFTPTVFTFTLGYGQWIVPSFSLGAGLKFISQNIDTESYSAVAVDLSSLVKLDGMVKGLQAGLAIQNLGSTLGNASLPMNAKAGLAYAAPFTIGADDTWNILVDVNLPFGDVKYTSANVGTEYWFSNMIAARVGYKIKDTGDLGGITGLTAGLGTKLPISEAIGLNIDYAMLSFGDLGMTHQIAISANFK